MRIVEVIKKFPGFPDLTAISDFTLKVVLQRLIDTALLHHQSIFDLQAEIKSLKSRVSALQTKSDTYITTNTTTGAAGSQITVIGEEPLATSIDGTETTVKILPPDGEGLFILTATDGIVGWTGSVTCD